MSVSGSMTQSSHSSDLGQVTSSGSRCRRRCGGRWYSKKRPRRSQSAQKKTPKQDPRGPKRTRTRYITSHHTASRGMQVARAPWGRWGPVILDLSRLVAKKNHTLTRRPASQSVSQCMYVCTKVPTVLGLAITFNSNSVPLTRTLKPHHISSPILTPHTGSQKAHSLKRTDSVSQCHG